MNSLNAQNVIDRLLKARNDLENLLPKVKPGSEIYPGWTIEDILAHIAGWDEQILLALHRHAADRDQVITVKEGINKFNKQSIAVRKEENHSSILQEFHENRKKIITSLMDMPEKKLVEPFISPWGEKLTIQEIGSIFSEHEEEHARDILAWLENPDHPIEKEGN